MVEGTTRGSATDESGEYFIIGIPAGSWTVRASMIGYADRVEMEVPISVDLTTTLDFDLSPQALVVGDEVVVVAERRLIRPDETQTMRSTTREDIQALPVTTFQEVLSSNTSTQGQTVNNLHVRGGRAGEATVLVDGMTVSEPQFRQANLNVGREALAEMQLLSGGFNAEYGDAASGVILITTREGTPEAYSGKIMYATDDVSDKGLTDASQNYDFMEVSLGGPEPLTMKLLPSLGVKIPGTLTFFLQGESRFSDRYAFHEEIMDRTMTRLTAEQQAWWNEFNPGVTPPLERGVSRELGTSDQYLPDNFLNDLFGIGGKRERQDFNYNLKLTYNPNPTYGVTLSLRQSVRDRNFFHFTQGSDIADVIAQGKALGIGDGYDNDGDGLIDEEVFNGIDDDGDGYIDELDAELVDPSLYLGGALTGLDLSWGVDRDQDGLVDEEYWNGVDDDGDGLVDEDMVPYEYNGWDYMFKDRRENSQQVLNWKHVLGKGSAFYEVKLSHSKDLYSWMPKRGKDGVSLSNYEEIRDWLEYYEDWNDIRQDAFEDTSIVVPELEPYLGFGNVQEPYTDENDNGWWDVGEPYEDLNENGGWDYHNASAQNSVYWLQGANNPFRGLLYGGVAGYTTGDDPSYYRSGFILRESHTWAAKFDITSQMTKHHQLKGGIEAKYYDMENLTRQLLAGDNGEGLFGNYYEYKPYAGAAYVQDKMEYESAIVNMGIRAEYFNPTDDSAPLPTEGSDVNIARLGEDKPTSSFSVLPRFGISFPVTDRDVFHFFYGHFFQQPQLFRVFNKLNQAIGSANDIIGNPYLDPEKTISYEFGIKHQFGLNSLATVNAYFKNVDNLIQVDKIFEEESNLVYHTYVNTTYGTVRGFDISLAQRDFYNFSGEVSYTYQIATTTHSSNRETYIGYEQFLLLPGKEYNADWDRTHAFSVNVAYALGDDAGPAVGDFYPFEDVSVSLLGQIWSGLPYTPTSSNDSPLYELTNTERFPWTHEWDLRAMKRFEVAGLRWGLQLDVYNIFDSVNAFGIDDTGIEFGIVDRYRGRIGYTNGSASQSLRHWGGWENAIPNPNAWDSGRRIRAGVSVEF
jgi:outer membrane receptor protein involved in Fe transport